MLERLRNFLSPYVPDNPEKRSMLGLLQTLLVILGVASIAALIIAIQGAYVYLYIPIGLLLVFLTIGYFFLRRGTFFPAQILLPGAVFVLITYVIATGYGLHDINLIGYAIVINLASLTLGIWAAFGFAFLIVITVFSVGYAEMNQILISPTSSLTIFVSPITISMMVVAAAMVQGTLIQRLNENLQRMKKNEVEQQKTNAELRELQTTLESRVEQRTTELAERSSELEKISSAMQKRAVELQAVAQVGKVITSIDNLNELLPRIAHLISAQFGYYHVGIFLLDETSSFAILSASNSPGGQKMIELGHKLKVGEAGIVGYVSSTGRPRITADTGSDAVFYNNPNLPDTHSEIALPLKVSGAIIGVLDVQSTEALAFKDEHIELLSILADQVSIAIQNARHFEDSKKSVATAQAITRQYVREDWQSIFEDETIGYRFSQAGAQPILNDGTAITAISTNQAEPQTRNDMLIPIRLHDQTIGTLKLQSKDDRQWERDTVDIAQAVAERVALAIENARLLERSQSQAARERTASEITAKIGASVNMRNVLQTAVEELGRILPGSDVIIQMESKK